MLRAAPARLYRWIRRKVGTPPISGQSATFGYVGDNLARTYKGILESSARAARQRCPRMPTSEKSGKKRQIFASIVATAPWKGKIFVSSRGDRRRKVKRIRRTLSGLLMAGIPKLLSGQLTLPRHPHKRSTVTPVDGEHTTGTNHPCRLEEVRHLLNTIHHDLHASARALSEHHRAQTALSRFRRGTSHLKLASSG